MFIYILLNNIILVLYSTSRVCVCVVYQILQVLVCTVQHPHERITATVTSMEKERESNFEKTFAASWARNIPETPETLHSVRPKVENLIWIANIAIAQWQRYRAPEQHQTTPYADTEHKHCIQTVKLSFIYKLENVNMNIITIDIYIFQDNWEKC